MQTTFAFGNGALQNISIGYYDAWGVCTIVGDTTEEGIAGINPFRYRSYYYDDETGLYYLQSRYYDPVVGRFINAAMPEMLTFGDNSIVSFNIFVYCSNDCIQNSDEGGMFSFDDLYNKITGFLQKLFSKFIETLKNQVQITKKYIKISVTVIQLALDLAVSLIVNRILKWGIEKIIGHVMKKYIQNNTKSFVKIIEKILNHGATKWLIRALIMMAMNLGYICAFCNAGKSVAIDSVLSESTVLSKINSICSACSSISDFIAFILDLADSKWDGYLTITFA